MEILEDLGRARLDAVQQVADIAAGVANAIELAPVDLAHLPPALLRVELNFADEGPDRGAGDAHEGVSLGLEIHIVSVFGVDACFDALFELIDSCVAVVGSVHDEHCIFN